MKVLLFSGFFVNFTHAQTFFEIKEKDVNQLFFRKSHPQYIFGYDVMIWKSCAKFFKKWPISILDIHNSRR